MIKLRLPRKYLNIHKRHKAIKSHERVFLRKMMKVISQHVTTLAHLNRIKDSKVIRDGTKLLIMLVSSFIIVAVDFDDSFDMISRINMFNKRRLIDTFSDSDCWNFFETRKEDLYRLKEALRIPDKVILSNGSSMPGEELMLRGLYQLVTGEEQYDIAVNVFGRDQSQQSRAFNWFINYIFDNFNDLVTNNLEWWYNNGYLHISMEAIKRKFGGDDFFNTCAFIDCNCLECSRPGGGPACDGEDATRWDPIIQKEFYNGWKSVPGLKHQTIDCAFGMTVDMFGPWSLHNNDLKLFRESNINNRLRDLQTDNQQQLTIYGDSIYPRLSHLMSSWKSRNITDWMITENKSYANIRINIEWNYMVTGNLYKYVTNLDKLKLLGTNATTKIYTVATILRNCHVALYGSITSNYFDITICEDFLEKYLRKY